VKTKAQAGKGRQMSKAAGQPSTNAFSIVADLLVEQRIKLDALEHVLKETNPLAHEVYLGTVENLQAKKAAELKKVLIARLKSELSEG
jgi:hypothetical protein